MARRGRPWAVVIAAVVSALVAAGALVASALLRGGPGTDTGAVAPDTAPAETSGVGADGCRVRPCTVLGIQPVGGVSIELVADDGAKSGRLRIGGGGSSDVIEVTITENGATLTAESLQCVPSTLSVCVVRGAYDGGVVAQVVVGRSGEWDSLATQIASDVGYLVVAEVTGAYTGAEVVAAQHRCDRSKFADCSNKPVFLQVYSSSTGELIGCTRDYARLGSLDGWPNPDLADLVVNPC